MQIIYCSQKNYTNTSKTLKISNKKDVFKKERPKRLCSAMLPDPTAPVPSCAMWPWGSTTLYYKWHLFLEMKQFFGSKSHIVSSKLANVSSFSCDHGTCKWFVFINKHSRFRSEKIGSFPICNIRENLYDIINSIWFFFFIYS